MVSMNRCTERSELAVDKIALKIAAAATTIYQNTSASDPWHSEQNSVQFYISWRFSNGLREGLDRYKRIGVSKGIGAKVITWYVCSPLVFLLEVSQYS